MKLQSSQTDQPLAHGSSTGWQIFGALELPFGVDAHSTIHAWLTEVLLPLKLPLAFLDKILISADGLATRMMQTGTVMDIQHTHLLIYIPANRPLNGQTWGFFRIEKVDPAEKIENPCNHSIEYYLYLEGQ